MEAAALPEGDAKPAHADAKCDIYNDKCPDGFKCEWDFNGAYTVCLPVSTWISEHNVNVSCRFASNFANNSALALSAIILENSQNMDIP